MFRTQKSEEKMYFSFLKNVLFVLAIIYAFTATMQKSGNSKVAQVMNLLNLDRAVYFVLRGGTDEQRDELHELIRHAVVTRLPLHNDRHPRWRRQMIVCRCVNNINDLEHIETYRAVLQQVFGDKCRIAVRVVWRTVTKGECL